MYLLFNLSSRDTINLVLFDQDSICVREFSVPNRDLILCIDRVLQENKIKKEQVEGIMVVVGEGGFTSERIAVTVANVFGYILQIPLLAINKKQAENPQKLISKLSKQTSGQYISATYSGEANITKAKRFKIIEAL
jgi:tRNA A37 threonylcarbamoyladenosine modification protein TsaB